MKNWEVLIAPAIAVAVWILASLFRSDNAKKPTRRPPDRFDASPPQRRPVQRVARPIEEARRREPPLRRPVRAEQKQPIMLEEVREPLRSAPLRAEPVPLRPVPVVLEVAEPEAQTSLQTARAEFVQSQSPSKQTPFVPETKPQPTSPTLVQVRQLLRSPQTAAVAFVLREILDAPRCRRPM